jgi:hypothetical protein
MIGVTNCAVAMKTVLDDTAIDEDSASSGRALVGTPTMLRNTPSIAG